MKKSHYLRGKIQRQRGMVNATIFRGMRRAGVQLQTQARNMALCVTGPELSENKNQEHGLLWDNSMNMPTPMATLFTP